MSTDQTPDENRPRAVTAELRRIIGSIAPRPRDEDEFARDYREYTDQQSRDLSRALRRPLDAEIAEDIAGKTAPSAAAD